MNSHTLPELLQEISEWSHRSTTAVLDRRWDHSQIEILVDYFSNVKVDSSFAIKTYMRLGFHESESQPQNYQYFDATVAGLLRDIGTLFKVPDIHQVSDMDTTLTRAELISGFINFLLLLIHPRSFRHVFFGKRYVVLRVMKELKILDTILGDTPFRAPEDEPVQGLLAKFEQVVNEAGVLVHSLIFGLDRVLGTMYGLVAALEEQIHHLRSDILNFLDFLPDINVVSSNTSVDSIFILDSVLYDLEDLMNKDEASQFEILYQKLNLCWSLVKGISVLKVDELKGPMMQLRDVAYEAEYLIKKDLPLWYLTDRLTRVCRCLELLTIKIQEVKANNDVGAFEFAQESSDWPLQKSDDDNGVDDVIDGFEDQERSILDELIGERGKLQVISIYGMPGIGKTTLARKLCHHPSVSYHFDKTVWCVITQMPRKKKLLVDILTSVGCDIDKDAILGMDEGNLKHRIYQSLKGMRYLIVMDDVWSSNVWEDFERFLPNDGNGSRVLFTSRQRDVAPSRSIAHELPLLSDDQCWKLLQQKIFHGKHCPPELDGIGKAIARKCHGLPLTACVIAGVLSSTRKEETSWKNVGKSLNSYEFFDQNFMMQTLELSYKHLPGHLKPCFLYFGVFRKAEQISVKLLKWLWIAQGFTCSKNQKGAESVAEQYLMELYDKSLIIVAKRRSDGGPKVCVIHDLLHDLCLRIAQKENFLNVVHQNYSYSIWNQKCHHLCVHMNMSSSRPFSVPYAQRLRTFWGGSLCSLSSRIDDMKLLRVLGCQIRDFHDPLEISVPIHLKFLAINNIPKSICNVTKLEFLIVDDGRRVHIFSGILKMERLRYIRVKEATLADDCDTSRENNLEYFSAVRIMSQRHVEILKCSPHLRRLKCYCGLPCEKNKSWRCLDLCFLAQLESLTVKFSLIYSITDIKFPCSIKKLNMRDLDLGQEKMSNIGRLPHLEILKLDSITFTGKRWDTSDDEFLQLKFLRLCRCDLFQWNVTSSEHFPKLQQLILKSCSYLMEIPPEVGEIATLQLISVGGFSQHELKVSARNIQLEQEEMGNKELTVIIESKDFPSR